MRGFGLVLLALLLWSGRGSAQVVTVSLAFASNATGIALTGSGTGVASLNFGTVQAFGGTVPSGVTKSVGANSWTLATTVDIQVQKTGATSTYTLTAQLQAADAQNTWKWDSATLSTTPATVTTTGVYGKHTTALGLTVPFSASPGTINNTINVTVTAN